MEYKGIRCNFLHGRHVTLNVMSTSGGRSVQNDVVNKYVVGELRLRNDCQVL